MRTIAEFIKTTLIGGILIVLPGLYRDPFDLESTPGAFGCGEADHGCNPRFRGIRGDRRKVLLRLLPRRTSLRGSR